MNFLRRPTAVEDLDATKGSDGGGDEDQGPSAEEACSGTLPVEDDAEGDGGYGSGGRVERGIDAHRKTTPRRWNAPEEQRREGWVIQGPPELVQRRRRKE